MTTSSDCSVVLVHGIGSQKPNWSSGFQHELQAELGDTRVDIVDAYWAPLSTLNDTAPPLAWPFALPGMDREVETFLRTQFEVSIMLAQDAGLSLNPAAIDPANFWAANGRNFDVGADLAADIAKYVARNSVRTAVQSVLHAILGQLHDEDKDVILVSHSQGTVIAYDVLRQAGRCYENVRTWITMGSPLRKYFAFPLQWGRDRLGVPEKLRWLNLYDERDIVGRDLSGALEWSEPQPIDEVVDNVAHATWAHNHWANPQVVTAVADEVRRVLGRPPNGHDAGVPAELASTP